MKKFVKINCSCYFCGMNVEVAFFVRYFALTLPFFTALTSAVIISSSCDKSAEGILNRRLLILLLSLMGTWMGFFLYFYAPKAAQVFLPVYALSVLSVPTSLYIYLYTLIRGVKSKSLARHHIAPIVIAIMILVFMGLSDETFQEVLRTGLSMLRPTFSVAYTVMTLYLLKQDYRRKRQSGKALLIPTGRLFVLVLLPLIQLINSIVLLFAGKEPHPLTIAATALLISILMTVLLYNAICRNLDLFRAKKVKIPKSSLTTLRKKAPKPPVTVSRPPLKLPFTQHQFEQVFLKEKLYLDPKLTLAIVCERFDTNRTYISSFINSVYGMNFSQYVNYYRLKELEWLQSLPSNDNENLETLSVKAGFTNYFNYRRARKTELGKMIINKEETDGNT